MAETSGNLSCSGSTIGEVERMLRTDRDNILHSWIAQRDYEPKLITRASGVYCWDSTGKRYLDFTSQAWYANIGHGNATVADAIAKQARDLSCIYRFATPPKIHLAEKLLSLLPSDYHRIFFGCNGSDAIEIALKAARIATGKQNVISFYGEYHGASMGATSVTGLPIWRARIGQPVPGTIFVPPPYTYRSPFGSSNQEEVEDATIAFLIRTIDEANPDTIAAVIGEPIITGGPPVVPSQNYWKRVRQICDLYGIILISDEVVTGFGRTGHWFARDYYEYIPDIICLAKGITSGYAPLSAAVFTSRVSGALDDVTLPHGLTYSGHAIGCAAALANIDVIETANLVSRCAEQGTYLNNRLSDLFEKHRCIGHFTSLGLFAVIELVDDRESRRPLIELANARAGGLSSDAGTEIMNRLDDRGVIVRASGNLISFAPPLTITRDELDSGLDSLGEVLAEVDREIEGK